MKGVLALVASLTVSAGFAGSAWAQAAAAKPDASKGQAIVTKVCAACHGADGNSPSPANPSLAGQPAEYIARQLVAFKENKERKNPVMYAMASPLSNEDIQNVAAYLGAQKPKDGNARNKDTVALGRKLYRAGDSSKGLPACASCHGATGAGIPAQYPRLAGQHAEYTESQLKAFRAKDRANDSGRMMRTVAEKMTDADIAAVADYVAGLR
jgi:cytochrome c553